jgi:hypothetical protein
VSEEEKQKQEFQQKSKETNVFYQTFQSSHGWLHMVVMYRLVSRISQTDDLSITDNRVHDGDPTTPAVLYGTFETQIQTWCHLD